MVNAESSAPLLTINLCPLVLDKRKDLKGTQVGNIFHTEMASIFNKLPEEGG